MPGISGSLGFGTPNDTSTATISGTLQSTVLNETAYTFIVTNNGTSTPPTMTAVPTNWLLAGSVTDAGANALSVWLYYRVIGPGEPTSISWTLSGGANTTAAHWTMSGCDPAGPYAELILDVHAGTGTAKTTGAPSFAGPGPAVSGFGDRNGGAYSSPSPADTLILNPVHSASSSAYIQWSVVDLPAGAVAARTITGPNTSVGAQFIFRAVPAPSPPSRQVGRRLRPPPRTRAEVSSPPVALDVRPVAAPARGARSRRPAFLPRRGVEVNLIPAQAAAINPAKPPTVPSRRRFARVVRRGAAAAPVPATQVVVAPFQAPQMVSARRMGRLLRRPAMAAPVPVQSAVVAPGRVQSPSRARRLALLARRGVEVVATQAAVVPPARAPQPVADRRRLGLLARLRRGVTRTDQAMPATPTQTRGTLTGSAGPGSSVTGAAGPGTTVTGTGSGGTTITGGGS